MSEKKPQSKPEHEQLHTMSINGQCALPHDAKRILTAPSPSVDKDDIAAKPLNTAVRGTFNLMR